MQNLKDAGCNEKELADICRLYSAGQMRDVARALRRHRLKLMEKLHESQRQVDCLDFLVYRMEKGRWQAGKSMEEIQGKKGREYKNGR